MKNQAPQFARLLLAAALAFGASKSASAATYNYTGTATGTDNWTTGANWDATPASGIDTIIGYSGILAAGTAIVSNNDNATVPFQLNQLGFTEDGPASGTAPTVTLQGNQLEFITNTALATPALAFNTTGTVTPAVDIQNNLLLTNNLAITATTDGKLSGAISGAGSLSKLGAGALTLSGGNSYTGATSLTAGTLKAGGSTAFNNTSALTMANAAGLTFDLGGFDASFTNLTTGAASNSITTTGAGSGTDTLGISAITAATGALFTDNGTRKLAVKLVTATASGNANLVTTNTNNTFSGGLILGGNAANNSVRLLPVAATSYTGAAGSLTKGPFGIGAITIGVASTDKAQIYFNAANTEIRNDVIVNSDTGTDLSGAIRFDQDGTISGKITQNVTTNYRSGQTKTLTITGQVTGVGGLTMLRSAGNPVLVLKNTGTPNDYAGTTTITAASTLKLGANGQVPNGTGKGNVAVNGTLDMGGYSDTTNGLTVASGCQVTNSGGTLSTLTIGDNNATGTVAGNGISKGTGDIAIIKTGTGLITFSSTVSSYTGGTTLQGGTLSVAAASNLGGAASNLVFDGGTLQITGSALTAFSTIGHTVSFNAGKTVGLDISAAGTTFTVDQVLNQTTGGFTKSGAGTVVLNQTNTYSGATTVQGGGKLTVNGSGVIAPATGAALTIGSNSTKGTVQYDSSGTSTFGGISVGNGTSTGGSTLNQTNGTINGTSLTLNSGYSGSGTGIVNLSGGTMTLSGATTISNSTTGAYLSTFTISGTAILNANGELRLTGQPGTGRAADGKFVQTGGTVNVAGTNGLVLVQGVSGNTTLRQGQYDLNGGTLNVKTITSTSTAAADAVATFNFNGGTLVPTASSATFWGSNAQTTANVQQGGAKIDTNGKDITIAQPLLHAGTGANDSLTKSGSGTLTLSGVNTYTGATIVNAGTLALASGGSIPNSASVALAAGAALDTSAQASYAMPSGKTFTISVDGTGAGSCGKIAAAGLDITNATVAFTIVNPLDDAAYVIASHSGLTGSAFASVTPPTGYTIDYAYSGGTQIALVPAPAGYASWISGFTVGDATPGGDPDNDGMKNVLEYVLNGNPTLSDQTILPALDASGANFVFTFTRRYESKDDTTQIFRYGTDLTGWTDVAITGTPGSEVTLGTPSGGTPNLQSVTVTIPKGANTSMFGLLKVTQP